MSNPDFTEVFVPGKGWVKKSKLNPPPAPTKGPQTSMAYNRELRSRATSVHKDQAAEYNEWAQSHGISGVRWDDKGDCYFSSRGARNEVMRRRGLMDMDAGYGDHSGR